MAMVHVRYCPLSLTRAVPFNDSRRFRPAIDAVTSLRPDTGMAFPLRCQVIEMPLPNRDQ